MEEEELDEARSLAARYVQRSPTVPIKVKKGRFKEHSIDLISFRDFVTP